MLAIYRLPYYIDDQDNVVFETEEVLVHNDLADSNSETRKPKSIKDLVTQWACEEADPLVVPIFGTLSRIRDNWQNCPYFVPNFDYMV